MIGLVVGSIRCRASTEFLSTIDWSQGPESLTNLPSFSSSNLSNSECVASYLKYYFDRLSVESRIIPLNSVFASKEESRVVYDKQLASEELDIESQLLTDTLSYDSEKVSLVVETLSLCNVIILITPVYFGDKSSVANKLFHLASSHFNFLENKFFSTVTIGAKRNGGQETSSVFALYEALGLGAHIIGSGPPVSQYGATLVAGDRSSVLTDSYGFSLLKALADNVSRFSNYNANSTTISQKIKSTILFVDKPASDHVHSLVTNQIKSLMSSDLYEFNDLPLYDYAYQRCIACNVCPPKLVRESENYSTDSYGCIFQSDTDDLRIIHSKLVDSSIVFIIANSSMHNSINRYQSFLERTRYLRRDDFMWTNKIIIPVVSVSADEYHNSILPVKIMSAFMRHNSVITSPLSILYSDDHILSSNKSCFDESRILNLSFYLKSGFASIEASYKSFGYADKSLDYTSALRS